MLRIAGIISESIVDGPGIRTVVFCQGCPHKCKGCHNQETWNFSEGYEISIEEIIETIKNNPLIKGVTFSGGEPFCQAKEFSVLAKKLMDSGYDIACYTGYTIEELLKKDQDCILLLNNIHVLIDGPFILSKKSGKAIFRGSSNQRLIDVKNTLQNKSIVEVVDNRWLGIY